MVNGGNTKLDIDSNNFNWKYVVLMRTLDFKSIFSYNDYTTTFFGDLNTDGIVEDIRTELTKTDEGCVGFTPIGNYQNNKSFGGIFDGKDNEIKNIYINKSDNAGLFGYAFSSEGALTIKRLGITGKITSTNGYAGGIVAIGSENFYNCYNKASVKGTKDTGGIFGHVGWQSATMENCYNMGDINSTGGHAGGCAGNYAGKITNCYNFGNISSDSYASGILGQSADSTTIINCYNTGNIESGKMSASGIIVHDYAETTVDNCYNLGNINVKSRYTTYSDALGIGGTIVSNSYNIGKLNVKGSGNNTYMINGNTINRCYYFSNLATNGEGLEEGIIDVAEKKSGEFVELLNSYTNDEGVYPEGWKKWKLGENGYPTFE